MGELFFIGILAVLGLAMFGASFFFQTSLIDKSGGAALFPRIIIVVLLVLLLVRAIQILRSKTQRATHFAFAEMFQGARLFFFILFFLYAISMTTLGFVVASTLFLIVAIVFLYKEQYAKKMPIKKVILCCLCCGTSVFVINYCFVNFFNVVLPSGILGIG